MINRRTMLAGLATGVTGYCLAGIPRHCAAAETSWFDVADWGLEGKGFQETAADFRRAYAEGRTTPTTVAERILLRVQELENADPPLASVIDQRADDLLSQARESTDRYQDGRPLGPLDGVPVGIKDELDLIEEEEEEEEPQAEEEEEAASERDRSERGDRSAVDRVALGDEAVLDPVEVVQLAERVGGVSAAMGWMSLTMIRLEQAESELIQQSENERLALWRMDSALLGPREARSNPSTMFSISNNKKPWDGGRV